MPLLNHLEVALDHNSIVTFPSTISTHCAFCVVDICGVRNLKPAQPSFKLNGFPETNFQNELHKNEPKQFSLEEIRAIIGLREYNFSRRVFVG